MPPVLTGGFCFNLNWALAKLYGFWLKPFLYTFVYLQLKLEAIQENYCSQFQFYSNEIVIMKTCFLPESALGIGAVSPDLEKQGFLAVVFVNRE
ncbi:hypothetical protein [Flavobacterium tistrianum]|uniref:hypothetical protein n=1 Tax=Flavobacterium tistrianum TaxID=1685414 RepID=UPI0013A61C09|nr:hypothetical protein [Flavobacterium tistrianum]KAF2342721.1 hypothetical protein DMB71_02555 [Flavobacterium tistrianum]